MTGRLLVRWFARGKSRKRPAQGSEIDGLDQVQIETGLVGLLLVFIAAVTGQGNDKSRLKCWILPQLFGDVIAVEKTRQADVAENHFGLKRPGHFDSRITIVSNLNLVAVEAQEHARGFGGVAVVFDHKDPIAPNVGLRWLLSLGLLGRTKIQRQTEDEF